MPQLFALRKKGELVLLACMMVDGILLTGTDNSLHNFIAAFNRIFKLGEIFYGPGTLRLYGMNIIQHDDYEITIHADDKIEALDPFPLSRIRGRQIDEHMNKLEKKFFMSANASNGWLGIIASPL